MNHGMLRLYKLAGIFIIPLLVIGCAPKESQQITIKKTDTENKKVVETNKIQKPKTIVVKQKKIIKQQYIKSNKKIQTVLKPTEKINKVFKKSTTLNKNNLDNFAFDLIKKGKLNKNTFLVVGGIQGDEPGGFMAASVLSTHYTITKGSVWIVPNLNFYSIIKRNRGPFGDMNRKFAYLPKSDPEYKIIQRIKKYITDPHVSLILNLHDGSGYYRPMYIDRKHQPLKWGQSSVIDQEILPNVKKYADTYTISNQVVNHINKHLLKSEDMYRTKNTHTRFKKTNEEQEMAKTLTYYAVTNGKAAFGHETSKDLSVAQRVYYKLLAIEKYMDIMGISYERKFNLTIKGIKKVLNEDISIKLNDTNINMPLKNIRNNQQYFPINKNGIIEYLPSNPLIKIIKKGNEYIIYYGNRRLTKLQADYSEHLNFDTKVGFIIDEVKQQVNFGDTIKVKKSFVVQNNSKFRVNVIGYKNKSNIETNKKITQNMILKKYSIENNAHIYRVEYYKKNKFVGMILVDFTN